MSNTGRIYICKSSLYLFYVNSMRGTLKDQSNMALSLPNLSFENKQG